LNLFRRRADARLELDPGAQFFAVMCVGNADDLHRFDPGMAEQELLS
jgi:hypothetical protein